MLGDARTGAEREEKAQRNANCRPHSDQGGPGGQEETAGAPSVPCPPAGPRHSKTNMEKKQRDHTPVGGDSGPLLVRGSCVLLTSRREGSSSKDKASLNSARRRIHKSQGVHRPGTPWMGGPGRKDVLSPEAPKGSQGRRHSPEAPCDHRTAGDTGCNWPGPQRHPEKCSRGQRNQVSAWGGSRNGTLCTILATFLKYKTTGNKVKASFPA